MTATEREQAFFHSGWQDDDERIDVYALFVLGDVTVAEIEDVLRRNEDESGTEGLWLADDYNNLPDFHLDLPSPEGTKRPLDPNWRSPFRGKTVADVIEFLRSVPKPRKPLCKTYFAILDEKLYREQDYVLVCKVLEDGRVQSIPCLAECVNTYFGGHHPHDHASWAQTLRSWEDGGSALMEP